MDRPAPTAPSLRAAMAGVVGVYGGFVAWLWFTRTPTFERLVSRVPASGATALHVFANAAVSLAFVALALRGQDAKRAALGLNRAAIGPALAWGLVGAIAAYVLSTLAVGMYFLVSHVRGGGGVPVLEMIGPSLGSSPEIQRELANKARWTAVLADMPLGWGLFIAVLAGVYEEIVFRGYILGRLRAALGHAAISNRTSASIAVVLSATLFAFGHGYQGGLGMTQTLAAGLVLGALTVYRRSIASAIVAHVSIDAFGIIVLHFMKPLLEKAMQGNAP